MTVVRNLKRIALDGMMKIVMCIAFGVEWAMRLLGPLLIVLAIGLIGWIASSFFIHLLPLVAPESQGERILLSGIGVFLLFNILFNYVLCAFRGGGTTIAAFEAEGRQFHHYDDPNCVDLAEFEKFCRKCNVPKPPRAHHCHICNRCILKMDHHCPWVGTCVGYRNYRFFCLFMYWLILGCVFIVACSAKQFFAASSKKVLSGSAGSTGPVTHRLTSAEVQSVMFSFVLCLAVGIAVSVLFGMHAYLILTGQTTIEFYGNRSKAKSMHRRGEVFVNMYDLGAKQNWADVFGPSPWGIEWMLPRWTDVDITKGIAWRTIADLHRDAWNRSADRPTAAAPRIATEAADAQRRVGATGGLDMGADVSEGSGDEKTPLRARV